MRVGAGSVWTDWEYESWTSPLVQLTMQVVYVVRFADTWIQRRKKVRGKKIFDTASQFFASHFDFC